MQALKVVLIVLSICVISLAASGRAYSHDAPLTTWGTAAAASADPRSLKAAPFRMSVEDRFPRRLESGGTNDGTPCSGTTWVYDYVHHIAAGGGGGPEMLLYVGSPPTKLPSRDLSRVSTVRGIRLGSTPEQVATALKIPITDVTRTSAHREYVYLRRPDPLHRDLVDLAMIVFHDSRAVSVWFIHDEN